MPSTFSFHKVIAGSPVLTEGMKAVLLKEEPRISERVKLELTKTILIFEDKVSKAAKEFIWTHPAPL